MLHHLLAFCCRHFAAAGLYLKVSGYAAVNEVESNRKDKRVQTVYNCSTPTVETKWLTGYAGHVTDTAAYVAAPSEGTQCSLRTADYTPTTHRLHADYTLTTHRPHTDYTLVTHSPHTDHTLTTYRPHTKSLQVDQGVAFRNGVSKRLSNTWKHDKAHRRSCTHYG